MELKIDLRVFKLFTIHRLSNKVFVGVNSRIEIGITDSTGSRERCDSHDFVIVD